MKPTIKNVLLAIAAVSVSLSLQAKPKVKKITTFSSSVSTTIVLEYSEDISKATVSPMAFKIPEKRISRIFVTNDKGVADPQVANAAEAVEADGKYIVIFAVGKDAPEGAGNFRERGGFGMRGEGRPEGAEGVRPERRERPEGAEGSWQGRPGRPEGAANAGPEGRPERSNRPEGFPGGMPGGFGPGMGFPGMAGAVSAGGYVNMTGMEENKLSLQQVGAVKTVKGKIVEPWPYELDTDYTYVPENEANLEERFEEMRQNMPGRGRGGFPGGGFPGGGFPGGMGGPGGRF